MGRRVQALRPCRSTVAMMLGAALWLSAAPAASQMELAVIIGHVVDEAGQPLEGVTITLHHLERGREITLKTDKDGRFYRRSLQAGDYKLRVSKEGYQPIDDKIKLVSGVDRRYDFKLAKATPAGAVEFVAAVDAYNRGDYEAAAKGFETAIEKAPNLPEIRVNLALAYLRLNRTTDAVAQLEKAAAMASDDPKILFQLGGAYIDMKEFDKAIAAFEKGLSKPAAPGDPIVYEALISLGSLYFSAGKIDEAKGVYDKALAANPSGTAAKLGLGKVAFNKGEVDKALELFKDVIATAPGTPEAAEAEAFVKALGKKDG